MQSLPQEAPERGMSSRPFVSVVIATFNRGSVLTESLETVLDQDYPNFEAIYVDDESTDDTPGILESFAKTQPGRLQTIRKSHGGMGLARNAGVKEARGDLILFTDDDVTVPKDWITRMVELYQTHDCDAVTGGFAPYSMDSKVERYLHYRTVMHFGERPKRVTAAPMMSFMVSKSMFWEVGGFDAEPIEDWVFCRELARRGGTIWYDPSVKVTHRYQHDWRAAAHRIRIPARRGLYERLDRGALGFPYIVYSAWRFCSAPFWSLWRYPLELYAMSLHMEALFFGARLKAFGLALLGKRLPTPH